MMFRISIAEIVSELVMEGLLIYVTYIFWKRYRRTANHSLLVLAVTFTVLLAAHTIWAMLLEDIFGYRFEDPFEPHHVFFMLTLIILIYVASKTQWRVKLQAPPKEEDKGRAA